MSRGLSWVLVACSGSAGLWACDRDEPEPQTDRPDLTIIETRPEPQDPSYPLEKAMRIRFNRYLRPASVIRQSVLVTPGLFDADSGAPKGPVYMFAPVYDPYERMVVYQLEAGVRWVPSTLHQIRLLAPEDESSVAGFRAFDGAPLVKDEEYSFMSGESVSDPNNDVDDFRPSVRFCEHDEVPTTSIELPAAFEVLRQHCATAGCHGVSDRAPVYGLDLSEPSGIRDTAIRFVARETLRGSTVGAPMANSFRFGDDMPRIDPGNPGNSYVVYKLLVNPSNHPTTDTEPDDPWLGGLRPPGPPPPDELSRLHAQFVRGEPMPLDDGLRPDEVRAIVRWIMQGAETPPCAPGP